MAHGMTFCGVALAALEMTTAKVTVGLHVSDDGLDGRAALQLSLDDAEHATLLAGDEDAPRKNHTAEAIYEAVTGPTLRFVAVEERATECPGADPRPLIANGQC